ncbi:MAG TPA: APC family permease, partial [Ktedonobacteraceae bacterium]|nr:APC family permease [Ktedonobacteraceae bacterium]
RSLGARTGFLSAWVFLIAQPLLLPFIALAWGPVTEGLIQNLTGLDIPWYIWIVLGMILLLALTYFGIKLSADASLILGTIEIIILLALSITMIITTGGRNNLATFTPIFSADKGLGGWVGIWQGMVFAFLAFLGFEAAAPLGEETTNPRRNIPRAVIFSAIGIGLFYVIASYAGVTGWGITKLDGYVASANPWADLGKRYWGLIGPILISFAIINSSLGNGNAGINATTRVLFALARAGIAPAAFGRLSKHQTPGAGILLHIVVGTVVAIGTGLWLGVSNAFSLLGTVLTLGFLLLYIASCVSTFVFYLRERRQDFRIWKHVIVPLIPTIILFFPLIVQVYPVPAYPLNLSLPILLVWIVIGVGVLIYLARTRPEALARGKEIFLADAVAPEPTPVSAQE